MKAKLAKLIDVKSIMTLLLTLVFCIMALCGVISGQEFVTIFTVIVGFYFGTQATKKAEAAEAKPAEQAETLPVGTAAVIATQTVDPAMGNDVHPPDPAAAAIE